MVIAGTLSEEVKQTGADIARCQGRTAPHRDMAGLRAKVAVVDDDPRMRHSIGNLLESAGYSAAMFMSAEEFLQAGPPAETKCLVLDVWMQGMDGLQLQHLLKTVCPLLRVIFVTAHYDEGIRQRAVKQGAAHFLRKPFDASELLRTVDECMKSDSE